MESKAPTFPFLSSHDVLVLRPSLVLRCLPFLPELAFSVDIAVLVEAVAIVEMVGVVEALEFVGALEIVEVVEVVETLEFVGALEIVEVVEVVEALEFVGALGIVVVAKLGAFLGQEFGLSGDLVLPIALPPCSVSMYLPSRPVFAALVEPAYLVGVVELVEDAWLDRFFDQEVFVFRK
jgi:hypothetical protein